MNILVVPTSDWMGHPVPSRLHYIFDTINDYEKVHVLRFAFKNHSNINTNLIVEEIDDIKISNTAWYYILNIKKHYDAIKAIINKRDIDVVVISNLLSGYVAAKAAKNSKNVKAIVFDLSDHFPTSGAGYYFNVQSFLGRFSAAFLEGILKKTFDNVDHIVVCSKVLKNYVNKLGYDNVTLVPNGVNDFFFKENYDPNIIREEHILDNKIVIGYIGCIEFWLDMLPLLEAINKLKNNNIKLMLVGGDLETNITIEIKQQIRKLGLVDDVIWIDFVPFTSVPLYISSMDICTIPFNHLHPTAYHSSPNKLYEYLALEKPVISTPIPEIYATAKNYVNFAITNVDYFKIISNYIENPNMFIERAKKGRELALERKWSNISSEYLSLLKNLYNIS